MKRNPMYQSGQRLVERRGKSRRLMIVLMLTAMITLVGGILGSGATVEANMEAVQPVDELPTVAPSDADSARDLTSEVRNSVICSTGEDEGACEQLRAGPDTPVIPVTGPDQTGE